MPTGQSGQHLTVAERAFKIFGFLIETNGAGVTTVAEEFSLPKSTAHVYLKTLESCSFVRNEEHTYHPSLKVLEHAGDVQQSMDIYQAAKEEIDTLARETGEVANLAIEESGERVIVYKSEGENAVWDNTNIGDRLPMHLTAMGKAMLAAFPRSRVEEVIDVHGLDPATSESITTRAALFEELEEIRSRGYSIEAEEHVQRVCAVGASILDDSDEVIGAIAIVGPKSRFTDGRQEELGTLVDETATVIALRYQHY